MEANGIRYSKEPKGFRLQSFIMEDTGINRVISYKHIDIDKNGWLTITPGYLWDGATIFPDTKTVMRASAIHDALSLLVEMKLLPVKFIPLINDLFCKNCIDYGMFRIVAYSLRAILCMLEKPYTAKILRTSGECVARSNYERWNNE